MELQGKVIAETEERRGTSARGEWVVKGYVIETHDTYPRKMFFEVFGADRIQRFGVQVGQEVNVSFDIDAREFNGRWFNSIRAFDVRQVDPSTIGMQGAATMPPMGAPTVAPAQPQAAPMGQPAPQDAFTASADNPADDLPF